PDAEHRHGTQADGGLGCLLDSRCAHARHGAGLHQCAGTGSRAGHGRHRRYGDSDRRRAAGPAGQHQFVADRNAQLRTITDASLSTASFGSPFLVYQATPSPQMPTLSPSRCTTAVLNGFSQIFLQAHPGCGLLILLAIALHAPGLMIGAAVGALVGTFSAVALGYRKSDIAIGLYGYNAALLGLLFVLLLGLSALTLGLIALGSVVTNLLQVRLMAAMRERNWLPGFTLPFVL